jgi:6-phosphogluconolactonase (cycloisomerase 2 family)
MQPDAATAASQQAGHYGVKTESRIAPLSRISPYDRNLPYGSADFAPARYYYFFTLISALKFSEELRMLRRALVLFFVVIAVAGFVSCGKNGSHFIYATIPATSQLAVFREDPYAGELTQLDESPYQVGSGAQAVVVHPSGKYLYVANAGQGENDISLFDVNHDGTVSEVTPRTAAGTLPYYMSIDPGGAYLYVANVLSNSISVYTIDSGSGALTPITGSPFAVNLSPKSMQIAPSGKFLYLSAPSTQTGFVAVFSLSAGVPTLVGLTPTADNDPSSIAITPNGSYLYTANATANSVSVYSIGSDGTLTQVVGSPLANNFQHPVYVTTDSKGGYLYVANQGSGNLATFTISSTTGFPAVVTDSPFATEASPSYVILDPNNNYLFVGNQAGSAGIQAFGNSAGSLNTIATYPVGNTPSSIAILQ